MYYFAMTQNSPETSTGVRESLAQFNRAIKVKELSAILGVAERTIYRRASSGSIPCFRIGTTVRFCPKTVADWFDNQ